MRTIVMTGGTSGFGAVAARRIAAAPDTRLLLGARGGAPDGIEALPLDLSSLASVRSFAASVVERLGGTEIDALVLNAGTLNPHVDGRTPEGFESTFAVNHLAHYLLLRLLLGQLAAGAVVVVTTSGTHDPAEGARLPPPLHADVRLLAHPEHAAQRERPGVAGRRAYTASKLCNVLIARALGALPEARARRIASIAYCPGQTPGTGLARGMPLPLRVAWRMMGGPLGTLVPQTNSREAAGHALAALALGQVCAPAGKFYAALRRGVLTWREPSDLALRDDVMDALWLHSAELLERPMDRLIAALEGHWLCRVSHEPNPQMPDGATSFGREDCRVGPGRSSILFDTRAHGHSGTFEGAGCISWNLADSVYDLYSLTSLSAEPGVFTGRWRGGDVVFDGYEYVAGERVASRHSITDIRADAFVYTIEMGSGSDNLTRTATIQYTRRERYFSSADTTDVTRWMANSRTRPDAGS